MNNATRPPAPPSTDRSYNYHRFRPHQYDLASFDGPRRGEIMADFELTTLDGATVHLSDHDGHPLVIETGSVTCPMYAKNIDAMNALARAHPDTVFIVLYVREAHPGERIGPHADLAAKRQAASLALTAMNDHRQILIDDEQGTAHQSLGNLPNMVYVIDTNRRVRFRGDWNDPRTLASVLDDTAAPDLIAREHFPPTKPTPPTALRTLIRGGLVALADFAIGLPGLIRLHRQADKRHAHNRPRTIG